MLDSKSRVIIIGIGSTLSSAIGIATKAEAQRIRVPIRIPPRINGADAFRTTEGVSWGVEARKFLAIARLNANKC